MGEASLKTVATYGSPAEAALARGRLEQAGISAFLEGQETGTTLWHVRTALGGVKLQVSEDQLARAADVLALTEVPSSVGAWTCGACGSQVDAGFEVCWSCGATFEQQQEADVQAPAAAPTPAACEDTEELRSESDDPANEAEELLTRAWRASLLGIVVFPGLMHLYSASLLARYHQCGAISPERPTRDRRHDDQRRHDPERRRGAVLDARHRAISGQRIQPPPSTRSPS